MLKSLEHYVRKHRLVHSGERIGVAVSGGADSVALLRAFAELAPSLGVVLFVLHLNHGLRGADSDADAGFARDLAAQLGLDCAIETQDVASLAALLHLSLEAAGRRARYAFFQRAAASLHLDAVATAHTRDDQAETVLLRLLRGTGTSGLAGIHRTFQLSELVPESTEPLAAESPDDHPTLASPRLIRPLLSTSRQQVERYLHSLHQSFRQDASNLDPRFLRNRVRGELLPALERDYNPALREALCETAEVASAENAFLEELTSAFFATIPATGTNGAIPIPALQSQPVALQRRILRRLCQPHALALDFAHLEALREFALASRAGRLNLTRGFAAEVLRGKHCPPSLVLLPHQTGTPSVSPISAGFSVRLPIPGHVSLGDMCGGPMYIRASLMQGNSAELTYNRVTLLSAARVGDCLLIRNLEPGDRVHALHTGGERKVNRLLQELAVPAARRRSWPVVLAAGRIVWVPGLPVAAHAAWFPGDGDAIILEMHSGEDSAPLWPTNR
ncbi:MAG TPA: tRNA lysidine(34) synthetase TilS [Candidatus Saccharimonadales bacterium]|nr:tRNA lysidine(34) synthetase TilS [Candidatus Saccharimonadales bacterium]